VLSSLTMSLDARKGLAILAASLLFAPVMCPVGAGGAEKTKGDVDRQVFGQVDGAAAGELERGPVDKGVLPGRVELEPAVVTVYDLLGEDELPKNLDEVLTRRPQDAAGHVLRGLARLLRGDHAKAAADFDEAIRLDPKLASAYYNRGFARLRQGKLAEALADCEAAVALAPDDARAYGLRSVVLHARGDRKRALADCDRALQLDPRLAGVHNQRCLTLCAEGKLDDALAAAEEAISLRPKEASYYSNRAMVWQAKGDTERALADLDRALQYAPQRAIFHQNRGLLLSARGEHQKAVAAFTEAVRLDPDVDGPRFCRGEAYARLGDFDRAIADYSEVLRRDPDCTAAYYNRGWCRHKTGDSEAAVTDYTEAIRRDPTLQVAYANRGRLHLGAGRLDEAISDFTEGLRLDPKSANCYCGRGMAFSKKKDWDKAIADLTEAIRLDPTNVVAYGMRGLAWMHKGGFERALEGLDQRLASLLAQHLFGQSDSGPQLVPHEEFEKAAADFTQAIRLRPDVATFYCSRASARMLNNHLDEAAADFARTLELDAGNSNARQLLGFVWLIKGEDDKAIGEFTEGIRLDPKNKWHHIGRATAHLRKRDFRAAAEDYGGAIRIEPSNAAGYLARGMTWLVQKEADKALADFNRVIELEPTHSFGYQGRALARVLKADLTKARADLDQAESIDASEAFTYLIRASIWVVEGEREKALADLRKAQQLNPAVNLGLDKLGDVATPDGPPGEARPPAIAERPRRKPPFTITVSRETTRALGPLREDGSVNYLKALNAMWARGVTPENNASVLLWQAMGPGKILPEERELFFRGLGIAPPPEDGQYFVPLEDIAEDPEDPDDGQQLEEQLDRAVREPWSKNDMPAIARWLAANEKPLALVVEATKRPRRCDPHIGWPELPEEDHDMVLFACLTPNVSNMTPARDLLLGRAMLRLGDGDVEAAWKDVLACHRLARLAGRGPSLIDTLVAIRIDSMACEAGASLARHGRLTVEQARRFGGDLSRLPPIPRLHGRIEFAERYMTLDTVARVAKGGPMKLMAVASWCKFLDGDENAEDPTEKLKRFHYPWLFNVSVDWDEVLRIVNRYYGRLAAACRLTDRAERAAAFERLAEENVALSTRSRVVFDPLAMPGFVFGMIPRHVTSENMAGVFLGLLTPDCLAVATAEDTATTRLQLARLSFSLAAYRAEHERYPERLAALSPRYIEKVPKDYFTGKDLIYRRRGDRYELYSLGFNGKDDGGRHRQSDADPEADDVALTAPVSR